MKQTAEKAATLSVALGAWGSSIGLWKGGGDVV